MPPRQSNSGPTASRKPPRGAKGTGVRHAYDAIRSRIVSLDLTPGADLDEVRPVRDLGLSRTPVRDALVRLAAAGLVVTLPNRTARVEPLGLQDAKDHLEQCALVPRIATPFPDLLWPDSYPTALAPTRHAV